MKFGQVVQEEMSFKEKVYSRKEGPMDDGRTGRRTKTDHNSSPSQPDTLLKIFKGTPDHFV